MTERVAAGALLAASARRAYPLGVQFPPRVARTPALTAALVAVVAALSSGCDARRHAAASAQEPATFPPAPPSEPAIPLSATEIAWESPDTAFERASREGKPVVFVFTATWCGQCRNYQSNALVDPEVIEASQDFVMVRVDIDERADLNRRYALDGGYVPRTLFFSPSGDHRPELRAAHPRFAYFVDPQSSAELLSLMRRARST